MSTHRFARAPAPLACALAVALLAGCSATPRQPVAQAADQPAVLTQPSTHGNQVLARGDWFLLVQPGPQDTLASLAARFLGAADRWWMIADYNAVKRAEAGRPLVIPLKSPNPLGVVGDEVQLVPILAYHRFGAGGGRMVVSPADFAAQLDWLQRNDYRVVRLADLAGFLAGKQPLPRRAVVLTIDDGYESAYRHALPLLRKHGFPATLFVYTDFVGAGADAVSWQQLQELASSGLVDIQAHSKTHRNLLERAPAESDQQYRSSLEQEVRAPREALERRLPVQVRHYAFPYGDANATVLDLLARQQYQLAVTVNPGGNAFFAQPFMLRRTMVFGDQNLEAFKARLQTSRPLVASGRVGPGLACAKLPARASLCGDEPLPLVLDDAVDPVAAFEQALRARALQQMQQGRLAEAVAAWDILAALRPQSREYRERFSQVQGQIDALVPERLRAAQLALRRGELDVAEAQFLAVIALQPDHAQAADALRGIERDRNRLHFLGKFSRYTIDRKP